MGFQLAFPYWLMMLSVFSYAYLLLVSYMIKGIFRAFAHFYWEFVFLIFQSSLYIINISSLSDLKFSNIFYQSMACISIIFTVFHGAIIILIKYNLSVFPLWIGFLVSYLKILCQVCVHKEFFPFFFWKFYSFTFYI